MLEIASKVFKSFFEKSTLKYLLVGFGTVTIDYCVIFIFYSIFHFYYVIAIIMGFIFANTFQFLSNFFFTFQLKKEEQIKKRAVVFIIVASIGSTLATLSVIFFESFIHSLYISKTLSLGVSFTYGFLASKFIIYNYNIRF